MSNKDYEINHGDVLLLSVWKVTQSKQWYSVKDLTNILSKYGFTLEAINNIMVKYAINYNWFYTEYRDNPSQKTVGYKKKIKYYKIKDTIPKPKEVKGRVYTYRAKVDGIESNQYIKISDTNEEPELRIDQLLALSV